jgi:nucleotide-binding universal stress UspA family protein
LTQVNARPDEKREPVDVLATTEVEVMITRILLAADGSEHAARAVALAGEIANKFAAAVTVIHAMPRVGSGRVPEELSQVVKLEHVEITEANIMRQVAESIVQRAAARLADAGVQRVETAIEIGDPATKIVEVAHRMGADLIVIGRRGLGGIGGALLGSVSLKVSHLAECACLTVK